MGGMGRFSHLATSPARDLRHFFQWRVIDAIAGRRTPPIPGRSPFVPHDADLLRSGAPSLTWIGHATFLLRLGGMWVATDPLWSNRISGTFRRLAPPGVPLADTPPIDVVTISHDHWDHLDLPTLTRIGNRAQFVVPVGCAAVLARRGLTNVVELDWWETFHYGTLSFTLVPARHWSMRWPGSRNHRLWGGFVIRGPEGAAYHAGDTGYFDGFAEIARRAGPVDWAILPIGAYDPEWFLAPQHMGPEDAGRAFLALDARVLVPMHWATFRLTDEPILAPAERLRRFWAENMLAKDKLAVLAIGQSLRCDQ